MKKLILLFFCSLLIKNLPAQNKLLDSPSRKLQLAEFAISNLYVDKVDEDKLVETAIVSMLEELDPHSTYSDPEEVKRLNEPLQGNFDGIGIQFNMATDTLFVIQLVSGGPSEKVGILAGDRIIEVNDTVIAGVKMNTDEVMRRLRGPKGSTVTVKVLRAGVKELLPFTIKRDKIPVYSLDASYMVEGKIGYIRVNRFAATTGQEFTDALHKLQKQGMKDLILDLQGNGGGYLNAAISLCDQILGKKELIVYTEGRRNPRSEFEAKGDGDFQKGRLVVLVDEFSASASEIFSGAIQDNDRGTIIGRRSFGKGLVQQPIDFSDGSAIRLTIARYYTPSGRCIQKPYVKGNDANYEMDILTRYEHGEFFSQDSIKQDQSQIFETSLGRPVYGGGGIMPDIFVPQDTTGMTSYYRMAVNRGLTIQFAFQYTDNHRAEMQKYETEESLLQYLKHQNILEQFARFAENKGLKRRNILMYKSQKLFETNLYGNIIYNMLGMEAYIEYLNKSDKTVLKALEVLDKGESFPKAPEQPIEPKVSDEGTKKTTAQADSARKAPSRHHRINNEVRCFA